MKNKFLKVFLLVLLVLVGAVALFWLPKTSIFNWESREVDVLSDVRANSGDDADAQIDSILVAETQNADKTEGGEGVNSASAQTRDTANGEELKAIRGNDVQPNNKPGANLVTTNLNKFFAVLNSRERMTRPVRVAYFGDSFIEADIFTSDFRTLLQNKFGGNGVGYVDIDPITASFRQTATTKNQGFNKFICTNRSGFNKEKQGLGNRYYTAVGNASFTVSEKEATGKASFFCIPTNGCTITAKTETGKTQSFRLAPSKTVVRTDILNPGKSVTWSISGGNAANIYYGAALESTKGIVVDNFSVRGSSGKPVSDISSTVLHGFAKSRVYDLIVLQYGLNIANEKETDYSNYEKTLTSIINNLRKEYPNASFLVVSISQRGKKNASGVHVMNGVPQLMESQRKVAAATGCAFWNLFNVMEGEGGPAKLAKSGYLSADYTHMTFKGGKFFAQKLFSDLMAAYGR